MGSGVNGQVNALCLSGNYLYVGGGFTTAGGKSAKGIARAYLLPLPNLSIIRYQGNVKVSWPSTNTADFTLQQAAAPGSAANWQPATATITDDGTNKTANFPAATSPQFFRLRAP